METEETKPIETQQEQEGRVVDDALPADPKPDSLSSRDAIRVAREQVEAKLAKAPYERPDPAPSQAEQKTLVNDPDMDPPSSFSAEAKEAWRNKDYKRVNQEYSKLERSRLQELTRAQTTASQLQQKYKPYEKMIDEVRDYLTVRGDEAPDPMKVAQAVQLVNAIRKDPKSAAAELQALGIDFSSGSNAPQTNSELVHLKEAVVTLLQDRERSVMESATEQYKQAWNELGAIKIRGGHAKFPDFNDNGEAGIRLGAKIGSRVQDPSFQKMVRDRFPDATFTDFVRIAYEWSGGRVLDEKTQVSSNQQHLQKSQRAAASTPGRATTGGTSRDLVGKLDRKAALRAAIAEARGR